MPTLFRPIHLTTSDGLRRRVAAAGIAATALSAFAGWPGRVRAREPSVLRIGGTGMALATMQQIGDAFMTARREIVVNVLPSLGTSGGLAAVAAGAIDVAVSARALSDAERAKGLHELAYARTPVAFVTHAATSVHGVTLSEVIMILVGTKLTWPDGTPIRLVRREPSDADWIMLRALSADLGQAVSVALARPGLLTVATDQENADYLERLPGSFGAMSIGQMRTESRRVVALALDGEMPSIAALADGRYKLSRTLHVVWRHQPTEDVADFLKFLRAEHATKLLIRLGHIALASAES
jgi:phosphate transport system substrate-binding protein